jgi:hypothetical protein
MKGKIVEIFHKHGIEDENLIAAMSEVLEELTHSRELSKAVQDNIEEEHRRSNLSRGIR